MQLAACQLKIKSLSSEISIRVSKEFNPLDKSISSHNNFEVREKRPKISDILQESNTLKNWYKNSNVLKSVEKPKNTEFKFFDHGLINLHAITNITRESVTQNQPSMQIL